MGTTWESGGGRGGEQCNKGQGFQAGHVPVWQWPVVVRLETPARLHAWMGLALGFPHSWLRPLRSNTAIGLCRLCHLAVVPRTPPLPRGMAEPHPCMHAVEDDSL